MATRLFARRKSDAKNPVTAAEAALAHKVAERRRIDEQVAAARTHLETVTQVHEQALLEYPDNAGKLAAERTEAQMQRSGLEGLRARIDAEIAESEAELALIRETAQRTAEADRLEAALADQASAVAEFEPAANKLIATLETMGASETARVLKVFIEQAQVQMVTDRAEIQLRADNLRKPPPPPYVPQIATPPAPHGEVAPGTRYRGFAHG
jgi:dsDNA-specific endonuclease/ATPase MutS2